MTVCPHGEPHPAVCRECLDTRPAGRSAPEFDTSTCRSCGAEVIWTETEAGRRMPVDADPAPDGANIDVLPGSPPRSRYVPPGTGRFVSHFSTCPAADTHRRGRAR